MGTGKTQHLPFLLLRWMETGLNLLLRLWKLPPPAGALLEPLMHPWSGNRGLLSTVGPYGICSACSIYWLKISASCIKSGFLTLAFLVLFPSSPLSNSEFTEHFWVSDSLRGKQRVIALHIGESGHTPKPSPLPLEMTLG